MYDLRIFGKNIRRYRQVRGLTQQDLAKKVGLTKDTISKIELGKQQNVGLKYLILIHKELGVGMGELFLADPEVKFIKFVISNENARSLEKLFAEIISILAKKEGK